MQNHKRGRPRLSKNQKKERKEQILQKLEPYLKSGLSIRKALKEAKIFNSEFYKYMEEDEFFGAKVTQFRQFIAVLVNQAIVHELYEIIRRQNAGGSLSKEDRDYLWWYALNSSLCKEEWGRKINSRIYDTEQEIQRAKTLVDEQFSI